MRMGLALLGGQKRQYGRKRVDREALPRRQVQLLAAQFEPVAHRAAIDLCAFGGGDFDMQIEDGLWMLAPGSGKGRFDKIVLTRAQGDAKRFTLLAEQYRAAPEVTRKRLYLETMQDVLSANPKVIAGEDNILYLPLGNDGNRGRVPTEAPVLRLPATQAASEPEPEARDTRRQGGR